MNEGRARRCRQQACLDHESRFLHERLLSAASSSTLLGAEKQRKSELVVLTVTDMLEEKLKKKKHHTGQGYVYFLLCRFSNVSIQYLLCDCAIFTNTEHTKHYCFPVFSVQSCRMFFSLTVSTQSLSCTWN